MLRAGPVNTEFGCDRCWPADPALAWDARRGLTHLDELIDQSHFHVMVLGCPVCEQRYVSVFTETIDWTDGEDPQYWSLLPVTSQEADGLTLQRTSLDEAKLSALAPARRCLRRDFPKGGEPRAFWGSGLFVGPHD
jgi:hypothetical protein